MLCLMAVVIDFCGFCRVPNPIERIRTALFGFVLSSGALPLEIFGQFCSRKSLKLTQKEVAAHMLMTRQQYSRFENGVFELNYAQIKELCLFLDITPNDLFDFK